MAKPSASPADYVHLNLVENGLDFLLSAAEAVQRDESPRSLKDAVLHVANGTELLFKARLAEEHWTLIFANPDEASHEKLAEEEFRSVDFQRAMERLEKIARVQLGKDTTTHLNNLRKFRNRLTHFTSYLDPAQAKSLVAKSMAFCVRFCEDHSKETLTVESQLVEIHQLLGELQEFVDERMKRISEELEDAYVVECPECWQETVVIDGGVVYCKFCRQHVSPQSIAATYSEGEIEDCPECGEIQTFATVLYSNDIVGWSCYSCGQGGQNYHRCERCYQLEYFSDGTAFKWCENCMSYLSNRE